MQNSETDESLNQIIGSLKRVPEAFEKAYQSNKENNITAYEERLVDAVLQLEKATLNARNFANISFSFCGAPEIAERLEESIANEIYDIKITQEENIVHISLPVLLPHYKKSYKCILSAPLNKAFRNYKKAGKTLPMYSSVVIAFINRVSNETSMKNVRDNDNRDYKQVVNTVAFWLLPDDAPKYCSMFNCTKTGVADGTDIYVIPKAEFGQWFLKNSEALIS